MERSADYAGYENLWIMTSPYVSIVCLQRDRRNRRRVCKTHDFVSVFSRWIQYSLLVGIMMSNFRFAYLFSCFQLKNIIQQRLNDILKHWSRRLIISYDWVQKLSAMIWFIREWLNVVQCYSAIHRYVSSNWIFNYLSENYYESGNDYLVAITLVTKGGYLSLVCLH